MSARITPGEEPTWQWPTPDTVADPTVVDQVFVDDAPARPARPRITRPAWTRGTAGLLIATSAVLLVGGLVYRLSGSARPADPPPVAAADDAVPSTSPSASPSVSVSASPAPKPEVRAMPWQGAVLPVSDRAGPATFTETRSTGFSRDPQGAAFAAVHISTHIDPYTGPDVFTPTIKEQVVGQGDLVAQTRQAYEATARRQGMSGEAIADGAPVLAPTGNISAWRIMAYRPDAVTTVELLVATPAGTRLVYEIPMVWRDGDWRAVVDSTTGFRVSEAGGTADFTDFIDDKPFNDGNTTRGKKNE